MSSKVQVCITIDRKEYEKYVEIKKKTGLTISRIIELELKGYKLAKVEKHRNEEEIEQITEENERNKIEEKGEKE